MEESMPGGQPTPMAQPMMDPPQQISLEIPFRERISRLFIFRFFWVFILIWPLWFLGIWFGITNFLQFFHMLFLGKRHRGLWETGRRYFTWMLQWHAYLSNFVDKRPALWWT